MDLLLKNPMLNKTNATINNTPPTSDPSDTIGSENNIPKAPTIQATPLHNHRSPPAFKHPPRFTNARPKITEGIPKMA
jgi:hypothetical protein